MKNKAQEKIYFITIIFLSIILFISNLNANSTCSYSEQIELSSMATKIVAKYELATYPSGQYYEDGDEIKESQFYKLVINILNITDKLYFEVTRNDESFNERIYYYTDSDNGKITIDQEDVANFYTYKITIYSANQSCYGELLREVELNTPIYNDFSTNEMCTILLDMDYCQQFVFYDLKLTWEEFYIIANNEINSRNKPEVEEIENKEREKSFFDLIKENIVLISGVIIVSGIIIIKIKNKKGRSSDE